MGEGLPPAAGRSGTAKGSDFVSVTLITKLTILREKPIVKHYKVKHTARLLISLPLLFTAASANAAESSITINPFGNGGNGGCMISSAEGGSIHHGPGDVKVTANNNFAIASCTVTPDTDGDVQPAFVERDNVPCQIKYKHPGHYFYKGFGGFTATPSGNVIARCKAELAAE